MMSMTKTGQSASMGMQVHPVNNLEAMLASEFNAGVARVLPWQMCPHSLISEDRSSAGPNARFFHRPQTLVAAAPPELEGRVSNAIGWIHFDRVKLHRHAAGGAATGAGLCGTPPRRRMIAAPLLRGGPAGVTPEVCHEADSRHCRRLIRR